MKKDKDRLIKRSTLNRNHPLSKWLDKESERLGVARTTVLLSLAKAADMTPQGLYIIMNGQRTPRQSTINKLCAITGLTRLDFLGNGILFHVSDITPISHNHQ